MNIVLSGPSGSGKGTLTQLLLKNSMFKKFVTCTTRKPRENEINGYDYFFIDESQFLNDLNNGEIHNVKKYGGNYYGSYEKDIDNIKSDKDIIFQLTPDRAIEMKRKNPNTFLVLVLPPNVEVLNYRRKDRSIERIKNDIKNLKSAANYDYVIVNDDLNDAYNDLLMGIKEFKNKTLSNDKKMQNELISNLMLDLNKSISSCNGVERVFNGNVAKEWDEKSKYVTYFGANNPIKNDILQSIKDGYRIIDIGCGSGKNIQRIDQNVFGCKLTGIDVSHDMINIAENKHYTGNNKVVFINNDFMRYHFDDKYDLVIFSYVLHHLDNPVDALIKARYMLSDNGSIIFSVPGSSYLSEIFNKNELKGRYTIEEMDSIVNSAGCFPMSERRSRFYMKFNSYEMFIKYLKSIGTYQKINGYTNDDWTDSFNTLISTRFSENDIISGEYLTYNCKDKGKLLVKRR